MASDFDPAWRFGGSAGSPTLDPALDWDALHCPYGVGSLRCVDHLNHAGPHSIPWALDPGVTQATPADPSHTPPPGR